MPWLDLPPSYQPIATFTSKLNKCPPVSSFVAAALMECPSQRCLPHVRYPLSWYCRWPREPTDNRKRYLTIIMFGAIATKRVAKRLGPYHDILPSIHQVKRKTVQHNIRPQPIRGVSGSTSRSDNSTASKSVLLLLDWGVVAIIIIMAQQRSRLDSTLDMHLDMHILIAPHRLQDGRQFLNTARDIKRQWNWYISTNKWLTMRDQTGTLMYFLASKVIETRRFHNQARHLLSGLMSVWIIVAA